MSSSSSNAVAAKSATRRSVEDLIGGTLGGFSMTFTGHPFDTLKVRLATQPVDKPLYSGLFDCTRKTVAQEGLGGLYKGVASPLAGMMVFNAVQFFGYGQAQHIVLGRVPHADDRLSISQYFGAGAVTGLFVAFVECPMDLFKSQLQVQVFKTKPEFHTVTQTVKGIWARGGVRGVYQGLSPTLFRNTFSVSMYFGFYEWAREMRMKQLHCTVSQLSSADVLAAGGFGGVMYWGLNYPVDLIKSTMQSDAISRSQRRFSGIMDTARQLYKEGGISRFYKGYSACMVRSVPANAACFLAYEKTKQFFA